MCVRVAPGITRRKRGATKRPWKLDGRRWEAKRFNAVYRALLLPLGGVDGASEADKLLARTAASLSVRLELLTAAMCRGEPLASEYDSIADRVGRAIKRLRNRGVEANKTRRGSSLDDYLKSKANKSA